MTLLQVKNLSVSINTLDGPVEITSGIDFSIEKGERLGIVGESGCGKSVTALTLMSLLPPDSIVSGEILLEGENLLALNAKEMCRVRGKRIGMIFQEPMTALNPVMTIGSQISESLILHENLSRSEIRGRVGDLMKRVGLPVERFSLELYPHQLSGGQRQRVMIAMAIACRPDLLVADEPTTALDVTVQEQILDLISELAAQSGMALIMISHDLGIIAQTTEQVMVMYAGRIMEEGRTVDVFQQMTHPYSRGLFAAIPKPGSSQLKGRKRLHSIPGSVPDLRSVILGCRFSERCSFVTGECRKAEPLKSNIGKGHRVWCYHPVSGKKGE